ncbi:hypothetical protein NKI86_07045 [Mesorhizobium sp. M0320]|uniref:hypothetical protein n=1 Tax=Mesorhizobium sp. M0320 TaxID=2956936 RepID=UPI00333BDEAE
MRRIDLARLNPSDNWRQRAAAAQNAIVNEKKAPSKYGGLWSELKPELAKLSNGKCWYCESRQDRSDNAVDHFRPKSVYPWYAVSYLNFRFACSFCNSPHRDAETGQTKGKSNSFPLFENSRQARSEDDIIREQVILLDPCNAADPGLLDFHADGKCCPRFPDNKNDARRVTTSITLYYLDHPELVERRRMLAARLTDWINRAQLLYPRVVKGDDDLTKMAWDGFIENIANALSDESELSAFARRIVSFHRAKPWVEAVLDTA